MNLIREDEVLDRAVGLGLVNFTFWAVEGPAVEIDVCKVFSLL